GGRAMFVWRTDDGGRSFSAPVALVPQGVPMLDHPGIAAAAGPAPAQRNAYLAWAGGAGDRHKNNLAFTRSTDGGHTFEPPATTWPDHRPSMASAGPRLAAGPRGLVCAVCPEAAHQGPPGDIIAQMMAVCSTDHGHSFAAPVPLGWGTPMISLPRGVMPGEDFPAVAAAPHRDALPPAH